MQWTVSFPQNEVLKDMKYSLPFADILRADSKHNAWMFELVDYTYFMPIGYSRNMYFVGAVS